MTRTWPGPVAGSHRFETRLVGVLRPTTLLLGTLLLGALGACGSGAPDGTISYRRADVETFLRAEVTRTADGRTVGQATCPPELAAAIGESTRCTVALDGVVIAYDLRRLAGGRLEATPEHPIIDLDAIEQQLLDEVGAEAESATCGKAPVSQLPPGQKITCTIVTTSGDRSAAITVDEGGYEPNQLEIVAGDVVLLVNGGAEDHSFTADEPRFDTRLEPGEDTTLVLTEPGEVPFHDVEAPEHEGTLTVVRQR